MMFALRPTTDSRALFAIRDGKEICELPAWQIEHKRLANKITSSTIIPMDLSGIMADYIGSIHINALTCIGRDYFGNNIHKLRICANAPGVSSRGRYQRMVKFVNAISKSIGYVLLPHWPISNHLVIPGVFRMLVELDEAYNDIFQDENNTWNEDYQILVLGMKLFKNAFYRIILLVWHDAIISITPNNGLPLGRTSDHRVFR
jgi:hypothetical protein